MRARTGGYGSGSSLSIVTIIRDTVLLSQISQRDDVGYGFRAEPNVLVVARHGGFPNHLSRMLLVDL
jgi:hypothetical protein